MGTSVIESRIRAIGRAVLIGATATTLGCSTSPDAPPEPPARLEIAAGDYETAFDAALNALRADGMPAVIGDRRSGIIESEAKAAPSMLEPWVQDGATLEDRWASTLAYHRRRAEIVFIAAGAPIPAERLPGEPALLGEPEAIADLSAWEGDVEAIVRVYLERRNEVGLRRFTWTRKATTRTRVVPPSGSPALAASAWTPISRDPDFERRLRDAIESQLGAKPDAESTDDVREVGSDRG